MKSIKILSIGNSFSVDAQRYLHAIAEANGESIECHDIVIGGCSLERHYNNMLADAYEYGYIINGESLGEKMSIKEALLRCEWDYVTLQQNSRNSYKYETYEPYALPLAEYVRKYAPKAKILIHNTWAYSDSLVSACGFDNHRDMYSHIERCYRKFAEEIGADGIIRTGEVIERLMNDSIRSTHRDGQHISLGTGRYAAALTFFSYLTGRRAVGTRNIELDEAVPEATLERIKETVDEALASEGFYYGIKTHRNVPYVYTYKGDADKTPERRLDMYLPDSNSFDVLLYFHGGGFVKGDKRGDFSETLARFYIERGIAYVPANYRMYPMASFPDFVKDAALAVKFVKDYLQKTGNSGKIYVGGTSAGGYLTQLLCFDRKYLSFVGVDSSDIAGYIHDAGQPTTHFNVLRERGLDRRRVIVDEAAPLYYVGVEKEYPPMLFTLADNDMKNRPEQTELLLSTMRHFGYDMSKVEKVIIPDSTHSSYTSRLDVDGLPIFGKIIADFIKRH